MADKCNHNLLIVHSCVYFKELKLQNMILIVISVVQNASLPNSSECSQLSSRRGQSACPMRKG